MVLPPGSRVTVLWTDGRHYSAILLGSRNGFYSLRFDGSSNESWAPFDKVELDGALPEGGMAAAAAAGVAVYDEGAEVMALRDGMPERCMIIEYVAERGLYNVLWDRGSVADFIDPRAIDAASHHGVFGGAAQEERNNPTFPVGTHVHARRNDGRIMGGTIIANNGERLTCRWDGERARQYLAFGDVVDVGGVAPAPPPRPGELPLMVFPDRPPTQATRDWYRDGDDVWAKASEDHWWYEATVLSREWVTQPGIAGGHSRYTIEWADGFGRTTIYDANLRLRHGGLF